MKRLLLLVVVIVGVLAVPAGAVSYDKSSGAFGAPGSQLLLATENVPAAKVGLTCDVVIDTGNNASVRPGSDITIASGSSSHVIPNTEAAVGNLPPQTIPLVLGSTVTATLTFGPGGAFSGTGTVTVGACETPPPPPP